MIRRRGQILLVVAAVAIAIGLYLVNRSVTESSRTDASLSGESSSDSKDPKDPKDPNSDPGQPGVATGGGQEGDAPAGDSRVSAPAVQPASSAEFEQLLSETLDRLPTQSAVQDMDEEEIHHGPGVLDETGDLFGAVSEQVRLHPELAPRAARFYEDCALKESLLMPVRALCLASADALPGKYPDARITPIDRRRLSEDLQVLAEKVSPK